MGIITLYHGTPNKLVVPQYGGGDEKHDYGKGFYLTESIELAKEWAVCRPNNTNGWVHKYELDTDGLRILDFQQRDVLAWLAELMKHREAADSKRYRMLAEKFIEKYGMTQAITMSFVAGELTLLLLYCERICSGQYRY